MSDISTKIEMVTNDDDIESISERQDLLNRGKKVVKSKSAKVNCCKFILIAMAVSIFIAMIIQIWDDYGSYLETHSLPPRVHSMSSHCHREQDTCMTKNYNAPACTWQDNNVTLLCTGSKPSHHMVETNADHLLVDMAWENELNITFSGIPVHCLHLTIWSI